MSGDSIPSELTEVSDPACPWYARWPFKAWRWVLALVLLFAALIFIEFQTSFIQSWIFTQTNKRVQYKLADGPSSSIAFPASGPFDERRGYSKIPAFRSRLESEGYRVTQQVQQSQTTVSLLNGRISPPYKEAVDTGMA